MERINIAELLKDCPQGMELDCTMYEGVYFDHVNDSRHNQIKCYINNGNEHFGITFTEYGQHISNNSAKCVIFPKDKNTWEGFQRPFKDGEILATDLGSVFILKSCPEDKIHYHSYVGVTCCNEIRDQQIPFAYKHVCHLATEEEKMKLFQAIKAHDYKWNPKTKTLDSLYEFKDGDVIANDRFIAIFHKFKEGHMYYHCWYNNDSNNSKFEIDYGIGYIYEYRFAVEKEKAKLFQIIKDNGYKWNPETKTLEKLPKFKVGDRITNGKVSITIGYIDDEYYYEIGRSIATRLLIKNQDEWRLVPDKFDINTLIPFESKVLVRGDKDSYWKPAIFGCYIKDLTMPYYALGGTCWRQCIPYEGNEHLLCNHDDCDEFYKTWE